MSKKIALWLLNRVAGPDWDREGMLEALRGPWAGEQNEVRLGEREDCAPGVLMRETEDADEYFVPIPVKCIGDPGLFDPPPSNPAALQETLAFYGSTYFNQTGPFHWSRYWHSLNARKSDQRRRGFFRDVRMVGRLGEGYYRSLQKFSRRYPGYRHVLVGYSQGGLVARYLAYLDERVFGNALIDGVVTLNSPNYGSPLARPANADNVAQALALVMAGAGQLDAAMFPEVATQLRALALSPQEVDIAWMITLLDAALERFRATPPLKGNRPGLYNFLATARKWLSGLESDKDNRVFEHEESSFFDLDIGLLSKAGSVLNAVNAFPLKKVKHAAIVGTDSLLDTFVGSGIQSYVNAQSWLWRVAFSWFFKPRLAAALRGLLTFSGSAYTDAMKEQALDESTDPAIVARTVDFTSGVTETDPRYNIQTDDGFKANAHDFVIPSAYQLIESHSDACLGNWVNPNASHLSGADPRLGARLSQRYLIKILGQLALSRGAARPRIPS
jgi:pimeloyl-ACP methyl ester carboxylesterase